LAYNTSVKPRWAFRARGTLEGAAAVVASQLPLYMWLRVATRALPTQGASRIEGLGAVVRYQPPLHADVVSRPGIAD
jgi:hypothetical protein